MHTKFRACRQLTFCALFFAFPLFAAEQSNGDSFESGMQFYRNENYPIAFEIFKNLADKGNTQASYATGLMYQFGKGINKDNNRAIAYYELAANNGHAPAQNNLASIYQRSQSIQKEKLALTLFRKAHEGGEELAAINIANLPFEVSPENFTIDLLTEALKYSSIALETGQKGSDLIAGTLTCAMNASVPLKKDKLAPTIIDFELIGKAKTLETVSSGTAYTYYFGKSGHLLRMTSSVGNDNRYYYDSNCNLIEVEARTKEKDEMVVQRVEHYTNINNRFDTLTLTESKTGSRQFKFSYFPQDDGSIVISRTTKTVGIDPLYIRLNKLGNIEWASTVFAPTSKLYVVTQGGLYGSQLITEPGPRMQFSRGYKYIYNNDNQLTSIVSSSSLAGSYEGNIEYFYDKNGWISEERYNGESNPPIKQASYDKYQLDPNKNWIYRVQSYSAYSTKINNQQSRKISYY